MVAELMNSLPKVVVSTTLAAADWGDTRLVRENVAEEIAKLKQEPGKGLTILGSPNLTASLLGMGLVDELRVMVHPILLGGGRSLFRTLGDRLPWSCSRPGPSAPATCCSPTGPPDRDQAMRRRTRRTASTSRTAARTTNRAVSMPWNSQKRSAGWNSSWL